MTIHHLAVELVRRSVNLQPKDAISIQPHHDNIKKLSPGGLIAILAVVLTFLVILLCFRYTFEGVVATLAFVEKESIDAEIDINHPPAYEAVAGEPNDVDAENPLVHKTSTIATSSLRRSLRHLRSVAGVSSYFRGFACFLTYFIAYTILTAIFSNLLYGVFFGHLWIVADLLSGLVANLLLIQLSTAWTHIVISEPSPKSFMSRLPPFRRTLRNLWAVTMVNQACMQISVKVPTFVAMALGITDRNTTHSLEALLGGAIGVTVLSLVLVVLVALPSAMALVCAQASMLPEEDETIVAFDRSFGGKVEPAIVGGSGALGLVDAWKTINRATRMRVGKLYAKIIGIEVLLHVVFGAAIVVIVLTTSVSKKAGSA